MSVKTKLRNALSAIDDAKTTLRRAQRAAPNDQDIRRALRDLDDAATDIIRARREVDK